MQAQVTEVHWQNFAELHIGVTDTDCQCCAFTLATKIKNSTSEIISPHFAIQSAQFGASAALSLVFLHKKIVMRKKNPTTTTISAIKFSHPLCSLFAQCTEVVLPVSFPVDLLLPY